MQAARTIYSQWYAGSRAIYSQWYPGSRVVVSGRVAVANESARTREGLVIDDHTSCQVASPPAERARCDDGMVTRRKQRHVHWGCAEQAVSHAVTLTFAGCRECDVLPVPCQVVAAYDESQSNAGAKALAVVGHCSLDELYVGGYKACLHQLCLLEVAPPHVHADILALHC